MIPALNGSRETVAYPDGRSAIVYDNVQFEDYPLHWHSAIEIIMPLQNSFTARCGGALYRLSERDVLIIPAGTLHSLAAQDGRRLIMLFDDRSFASDPALAPLNSLLRQPILIDSGAPALRAEAGGLLREIYSTWSEGGALADTEIHILLLRLLCLIYREGESRRAEQPRPEGVRAAMLYIEQHYREPLTLDTLAEAAGYSRYHFSRLLRQQGTDFTALVNRRRLQAAELMLRDEGISVTEAALSAGFASLTTFNRVFKEEKGCTPTEFRRLYKRENR